MRPLRLLQVEDTEDDAALIELALKRAGDDVLARCVDNADGLRRELGQSEWDLVIADYTMPGFSGTKALAIVREPHPDLPFIFVSGTIGEDTAVAAMRTGAHDYIMKGNLKRLAPAVERELREATIRRERHLANQRVACGGCRWTRSRSIGRSSSASRMAKTRRWSNASSSSRTTSG